MTKFLTSLIVCVALTGCGEVVVFGHVVRENQPKAEAAPSQPATEAPAPAAATPAPAATQTSAAPVAANAPSVTKPAAPEPATVVISTPAGPQSAAVSHSGHLLHAVDVKLSPESRPGDAGVDAAALLDAIRTELRSRKLLDEQSGSADGTAEVLVEGATTHPTVNAVLFGFQPMAGTLTGELHVSSARGERPPARIVAESRFNLAADGENKNALAPLYRRFAALTADEIAGTAAN